MRSLTLGSLMVGLVGGALLIGCGDDTTSAGGNGTGGNTGAGNTGAGNTGAGNTGAGNTGGAGGSSACIEITDVTDFSLANGGTVVPNIGGADPDFLQVLFTAMQQPGMTTFSAPANAADCGDTVVCNALFEDATMAGTAAIYLATSGSMDLTSFDGEFYGAGSMTDVNFQEIAIDEASGDITVVPNGKCAHLASYTFSIEPPVAGWTCDPSYYGAMDGCDCECGALDSDCSDPMAMVYGCQEGQTCDANAHCAGVPTAWTCAADQYDGGAGNGCDCACGTVDPDCDLMGEMVDGCQAGEVCGAGKCLPAGWTCSAGFYDSGVADDCDCGCGVADPDCADATKASCNYCNDMGSCDTVACDDPASTINATNNATCN